MKDLTKLTSRQIAQIKNIYKANSSIYSRIDTLKKHLDKLQAEYDENMAIIDANEAGVKLLTDGYISKQLIKDEQIPQFNEDGTPKMDKEGKYQVKKRLLTFVIPVGVEDKVEEAGAINSSENTPIDDTPSDSMSSDNHSVEDTDNSSIVNSVHFMPNHAE